MSSDEIEIVEKVGISATDVAWFAFWGLVSLSFTVGCVMILH
jgi:hypothetical protein